MKKFTKIIICLLLCVVSLAFVACDKRSDKEKAFTYPSREDIVTNNGGYAVQKGNYLYFVNGFVGVKDEENVRNGSFTHGALMMMKLDNYGNIVTNENDLLKDDYYITMSDRLCGFEATNLFISGDYLYFTAVCQEDEGGDNKGTWAQDRVDFCRIKLDKTGEVERVYVSETKYSEIKFEYYESNGNTFILVYENGSYIDTEEDKTNTLVRVDCNAKTSHLVKEDVSSVVLNKDGNKIFFIESDVENSEYTLFGYNIFGNQTTEFEMWSSLATVKLVGEDYVYVTYSMYGTQVLGRASNDKNNITEFENVQNYIPSGASFIISEVGDQVMMVNKNEITVIGTGKVITDTDATEINVIGVTNGSVIYYDGSNNLKSVSYSANNADVDTIAEKLTFEEGYLDMSTDDAYMYFYKNVGSHKYLHRIKIVNTYEEQSQMVGVYIDSDAESR